MSKVFLTNEEQNLLSLLSVGEENAKTMKELRGINSRDMRFLVSELRVKGYPICSGHKGYWLGKDLDELNRTINNISSRRFEMGRVVNGLKKSQDKLGGKIWD